MRKALALASLLLCTSASAALAGRISPGLERRVAGMEGSDEITVLVVLRDQAPIASLDQDLHAARAPLAARHRAVVDALREAASRSQQPILTELALQRAAGPVRGFTPYWIINALTVATTVDGARELARRDDVDVVEPDLAFELVGPAESPEHQEDISRGLRAIGITPGVVAVGARQVWTELGIDGTGALVGNMDTGVDGTHPALAARWRGNFAPAAHCWRDAVGFGDTTPEDHHFVGHGTHVMGTICGLAPNDSIGVAPGALWIADNTINQNVGVAFDNDVLTGLQWFSDPDGNSLTTDDVPDVVQNSWRVNEGFAGYVDCDSRWWTAIDNCEAAGVVLTWSAGNEGPGGTSIGSPADRATTPYNCFSVGATIPNPPYTIASFSSRGPSGCGGAFATKPEIAAPGQGIYSAQPGGGYQYLDGTSMAGPHIAGVVALMRAANPDVDVQTIKQILMDTATDLGPAGEDNTYGHGFVNAYEAVLAVLTGYGQVEGTVTDLVSGNPLPGVAVQVVGDLRNDVTDGSGFFQIHLPAGPWTLEFSEIEHFTGTLGVDVVAGQAADGSFAMTPLPDPVFSVDPGAVTQILPPDGMGDQPITLVNSGDGELEYTASLMTAPAPRSARDPQDGQPGIRASGGPDAFGHYWIDSDDPAGPTYSWVELQGVGTQYLLGDNSYSGWIQLGFSFPFYGNNYTQVRLSSNGFASFSAPDGAYATNGGIPSATDPDDMIAAFWDDLNPGESGAAVYAYRDTANSRFIAEWRNVPRAGTGGTQRETFEIILYPDGTAVAQYQTVSNPTSATVGIENVGGTDGLEVVFDAAYLHNAMAVRFQTDAPVPWLSVAPRTGTVAPQSSGYVTASFDATGMALGSYEAAIRFSTNDPNNAVVIVPVTLNVSDATSVDGVTALPARFDLGRPQPNPSGSATSIRYAVPAGGADVSISIYDVAGRHVRALVRGAQPAGHHVAVWDGRDRAGRRAVSGVYFYRMEAGDFSQVRKVTILE
jgi:subtilisin family serine protease